MAYSTHSKPDFGEIIRFLKRDFLLWTVPMLVLTGLAALYALWQPAMWQATQAILVRDEVGGNLSPLGRFDSSEAMKTAQETILEIAKSQKVIRGTLLHIGAPDGAQPAADWPTGNDIERLQNAITVKAPNGAEFGQTEVIHLAVKSSNRQRAIDLARVLCDSLDFRLRELRDEKARSISTELEKAVKLARAELDVSTDELQALESDVGADLGELRSLSNSGGGDSNLRTALNQITTELRQARAAHEIISQQHNHLLAARDNPNHMVAIPNRLLESQPALHRLKDGLVDAQLETSKLMGRMSENHPHVQAAIVAEHEVRDDLRSELEVALNGLQVDLQMSQARLSTLENQEKDISSRLDQLAKLRAGYSNLVDELAQRTGILQQAQNDLADARASQSTAQSSSLITRLDRPVAGNHPLGPGKFMTVLYGMFGGLILGLGLVFLKLPMGQIRGRRWSDFFPTRRRSDQLGRARHLEGRRDGRRSDDACNQRRSDDQPPLRPPADPSTGDERRRGHDRRSNERRTNGPPRDNTAARQTFKDITASQSEDDAAVNRSADG